MQWFVWVRASMDAGATVRKTLEGLTSPNPPGTGLWPAKEIRQDMRKTRSNNKKLEIWAQDTSFIRIPQQPLKQHQKPGPHCLWLQAENLPQCRLELV